MFATVTLLTLVNSVSGTPYISGGDSARGTDCSGLVSWVANAASGRPIYGDRFNTGNIEKALLARGFQYGSHPGALNVGWNGGHTAATLPDGTPVSSGEGGGVRVGGGGAFQKQFGHHMFLPMAPEDVAPAPDAMPEAMPFMPPAPEMVPPPAPEAPVVMMAGEAPAPEMAPPAPDAMAAPEDMPFMPPSPEMVPPPAPEAPVVLMAQEAPAPEMAPPPAPAPEMAPPPPPADPFAPTPPPADPFAPPAPADLPAPA
jgi:hypothetical protein